MLISQASRAVAQLEVQGKACKALWVTALFASFIPRDLFSVATTRLWLYGVSFVRSPNVHFRLRMVFGKPVSVVRRVLGQSYSPVPVAWTETWVL